MDYVAQGDTPQQAFIKISNGYLSDRNKLPSIYDISRVTSFTLKEPSDGDMKNLGPEGIFNNWRKTVFDKYKAGEINIDNLMNDLDWSWCHGRNLPSKKNS